MKKNEKDEYQIEVLQGEIWRDIPSYETLYQASNYGRIKSLGNSQERKEKILKQQLQRNGYKRVMLYKRGLKPKNFPVHRLVASAYIPNPLKKEQVNHENGNKKDNSLGNLNWVSRKENIAHAFKTGLVKKNTKPVIATHLETGEQRQFKSQARHLRNLAFI